MRYIQKRFLASVTIFLLLFVTTLIVRGAHASDQEIIWGGLAWSPDGQTLAVATNMGIDLHRTSELAVVDQLTAFPSVSSLDWSPRSGILVSGYSGGEVLLWRKDTQWSEILISRHDQQVGWVRISPDGRFVASSGLGSIKIYDSQQHREVFTVIDPNCANDVCPMQWSADGNYLITDVMRSKNILFYNLDSGHIVRSVHSALGAHSFKLSPNGRIFAGIVDRVIPSMSGEGSFSGSGTLVQLWDASTGEILAIYDTKGLFANAIAWSPDSTLLAVQSTGATDVQTGQIDIWNISSNRVVTTLSKVIMTGDAYYNNAIAWSPNGDRLASVSDDGRVIVWDSKTFDTQAVYDEYKSIVLNN